jgi:hypothetical protein
MTAVKIKCGGVLGGPPPASVATFIARITAPYMMLVSSYYF